MIPASTRDLPVDRELRAIVAFGTNGDETYPHHELDTNCSICLELLDPSINRLHRTLLRFTDLAHS